MPGMDRLSPAFIYIFTILITEFMHKPTGRINGWHTGEVSTNVSNAERINGWYAGSVGTNISNAGRINGWHTGKVSTNVSNAGRANG